MQFCFEPFVVFDREDENSNPDWSSLAVDKKKSDERENSNIHKYKASICMKGGNKFPFKFHLSYLHIIQASQRRNSKKIQEICPPPFCSRVKVSD